MCSFIYFIYKKKLLFDFDLLDLAVTYSFTHPMGYLSMNWHYLCQEIGSHLQRRMMTYAPCVVMEEISCAVIIVQGHFTKVIFTVVFVASTHILKYHVELFISIYVR